MDQALNSQKTPHTSPLRASYGMSFVSILMKNDRVIKGFYCMWKTRMRNIIAAPGKCQTYNHVLLTKRLLAMPQLNEIPDNKVHGAIMGPIWGRQDPGGPHIGPMNFAIWDSIHGEFTTRNRVCRVYDALDFIVTGFLWLCSELLMIYCRI